MNYRLLSILTILLFVAQILTGQEKGKRVVVSGTVTDRSGNPVAGALFFADNVKINKTSDSNGYFRFKIKPETMMIRVVSLTHGTIETEYAGNNKIEFIFEETPLLTDDEVVTADEVVEIGYGKVRKKDMTMNATGIEVNDNKSLRYRDIYEMIKGEVVGVVVNGTSITVQGTGSIMSNTEPLFIVNGMETTSIADIPPTEVASISVLKGPSASIYGSRGAAGVIIIKLK